MLNCSKVDDPLIVRQSKRNAWSEWALGDPGARGFAPAVVGAGPVPPWFPACDRVYLFTLAAELSGRWAWVRRCTGSEVPPLWPCVFVAATELRKSASSLDAPLGLYSRTSAYLWSPHP